MPQVILGIDPGLRHTGYCVLVDGKPREHGVILLSGHGKVSIGNALSPIFSILSGLISEIRPDCAAVEQVGWYGSRKAITLPLSHVCGGIVGFCAGRSISTYLFLANQRRPVAVKRPRRGWQEHDLDAYELALLARQVEDARGAGDRIIPRRLLAAFNRKIIVGGDVHGSP